MRRYPEARIDPPMAGRQRNHSAMKLSLDDNSSHNLIRAYTQGRLTVNEETITASVILTPDAVVHDWPPQHFEDLCVEHIECITQLQPEIILLGTGAGLRFPSAEMMHHALRKHIGIEVMDTAAACRTYNILCMEGRKVAAALLMI